MSVRGRETSSYINDVSERVQDIRNADDMDELQELTGEDGVDDAYFTAKRQWYREMEDLLSEGLGGVNELYDSVQMGGTTFSVHGTTHVGTAEEREYVEENIDQWISQGDKVFVEQGLIDYIGIDLDALTEPYEQTDIVETMDDRAWAYEAGMNDEEEDKDEGDMPLVQQIVWQDGSALAQEVAENPDRMNELERYYEKTMLPVHLERGWLQQHAPEEDRQTHGRSERMADYAVHNAPNSSGEQVHIVTGQRHRTGILEYLEQYQTGEKKREDDFVHYPRPQTAAD